MEVSSTFANATKQAVCCEMTPKMGPKRGTFPLPPLLAWSAVTIVGFTTKRTLGQPGWSNKPAGAPLTVQQSEPLSLAAVREPASKRARRMALSLHHTDGWYRKK